MPAFDSTQTAHFEWFYSGSLNLLTLEASKVWETCANDRERYHGWCAERRGEPMCEEPRRSTRWAVLRRSDLSDFSSARREPGPCAVFLDADGVAVGVCPPWLDLGSECEVPS